MLAKCKEIRRGLANKQFLKCKLMGRINLHAHSHTYEGMGQQVLNVQQNLFRVTARPVYNERNLNCFWPDPDIISIINGFKIYEN